MPSVDPAVLAEKQRRKRLSRAARHSQTQPSNTPSGPSSIPFPVFDDGKTLLVIQLISLFILDISSTKHTSYAKSTSFF
jgi:hypothetical protein